MTSLATAGVLSAQIQAIGRWKSDTFEYYIRHHSTLLQAVLFHGQSIHDLSFDNILESFTLPLSPLISLNNIFSFFLPSLPFNTFLIF